MKYNILYIDDEAANLRVFKSVFRRDFNVSTALSGKDGLKLLDIEKFHLIITDQRMPEMTGVEFLKEVFRRIPVKPPNRIILSGFSKNRDIDEAKEKYFLYKFVSKPWNADDLRVTIDEAIVNTF
jgi:response regulator RpfG family c-di-GMP phosphodiesterase